MELNNKTIETHPFEPFIFPDTRILIMGTFPPTRNRWSMKFYYPNRINDFWYMMGLIFRGDKLAFYDTETELFKLEDIKALLKEKHIGLSDTGYKVHRMKGNASDKFLEIIEPVPLGNILTAYPSICALCTTGEKAATIVGELTRTEIPKIGKHTLTPKGLEIWRMPSTSRAYPLPLEKKAEFYAEMFRHLNII